MNRYVVNLCTVNQTYGGHVVFMVIQEFQNSHSYISLEFNILDELYVNKT